MKNNKLKAMLVLTLIFTLVISAPIGVSAKTKKIQKPKIGEIRAFSSYCTDEKEKCTAYCLGDCKRAKKIEYYRATTKSGKYKKVATVKNGRSKQVEHAKGLYFYKARGINGKKKGKFCKPEALYNVDIWMWNWTSDKTDRSVMLTYSIDNRGSDSDIIFSNKSEKNSLLAIAVIDGDYQGIDGSGVYVDVEGNPVDSIVVPKDSIGVVNVKCTYDFGFDGEYTEAEKDHMMDYAEKALEAGIKQEVDYEYQVDSYLPFSVESEGKTYNFSSTLLSTDSFIVGQTFPEHF